MWFAILSGLLVSIDALFIGVSFGTQKTCRFIHIFLINIYLFALCLWGFAIGILVRDNINFDFDLIIGIIFITFGIWTILFYFLFIKQAKNIHSSTKNIGFDDKQSKNLNLYAEFHTIQNKKGKKQVKTDTKLSKNVILTGIFMSIEAMIITIGLTLMLDTRTIFIPITIAIAHFIYCTTTFFFSKYLRKLPHSVGHTLSGLALVIYGIMALTM